ncbi:insulinase-like protease [Cryptosporidium felis]|nr:insulinase-like protease [Cryptosporidium felis]
MIFSYILLSLSLILSWKPSNVLDFQTSLVGASVPIFRISEKSVGKQDNNPFLTFFGDEKFIKPVVTDKVYAFLRLENELDVFLISQKNTTLSSARLGVKVGSGMEPESLPGLAHYLEHLLFINTQKYPELDGFMKFIEKNNGYTNAHTGDFETVYEMDVASNSFEEAVSRFSEFFKTPLFDVTYTEKELMAVENEFNYAKNYDSVRLIQVLMELSTEGSIYRKFSFGNLETLRRIPESKGINVREEVIKFYEKEYSSNRMVLVLAGSHSLDELKELALKYFSGIRNRHLPVPSTLLPIQNFPVNPLTSMLGKIVFIESLNDGAEISFVFPLKRYMSQYKSQGRTFLLEKLISSERRGTLHNYLFSKEIIRSSDMELADNKIGFTYLTISFSLTKEGEKSLGLIALSVFSVLKFAFELGHNEEIYSEHKNILDFKFKYQDLKSSSKEANDILETYFEFDCKPEEVLVKNFILENNDPKIQAEINSQLVPNNFIILLQQSSLKSFLKAPSSLKTSHLCNQINSEGKLDPEKVSALIGNSGFETLIDSEINIDGIIEERYTKAKYITKSLNSCLISQLFAASSELATSQFEITPPQLNPYIPKHFSVNMGSVSKEEVPVPLKNALEKFLSVASISSLNEKTFLGYSETYKHFFYLPTKTIEIPKVVIQLKLIFPLDKISEIHSANSISTLKLQLLITLLSGLIGTQFSRNLHEIEAASYTVDQFARLFSNSCITNQLVFLFTGFIDKISQVTTKIAELLKDFTRNVTASDFNTIKESQLIYIKNSILNPQISDNYSYLKKKIFMNQDLSSESTLSQLESISFQDLVSFSNFFFGNFRLEGFICGNLTPLESAIILDDFTSTISNVLLYSEPTNLNSISKWFEFQRAANYLRSLFLLNKNSQITHEEISDPDLLSLPKHFRSLPPIPKGPETPENLQIIDLLSIRRGSKFYYHHVSNSKTDVNSAVICNIAIGYSSTRNIVLTKILAAVISSHFFTEIRTEKQLGYIVSADYYNYYDHISGIRFLTVSSNQNIKTLSENVLQFWEDWFSPNSNKISKSNFNSSKLSYLQTLRDPLISLGNVFSEYVNEIDTRKYGFQWRQETINLLEELTFEDFITWFRSIYHTSNHFLLSIQSQISVDSQQLENLSKYVPENFTELSLSDSLFDLEGIKTYNQWQVFRA